MSASAPLLQTIEADEPASLSSAPSGRANAGNAPKPAVVLTPSSHSAMASTPGDAEAGMASLLRHCYFARLTAGLSGIAGIFRQVTRLHCPHRMQKLTVWRIVVASSRPEFPLRLPNSCHCSLCSLWILHEQLCLICEHDGSYPLCAAPC